MSEVKGTVEAKSKKGTGIKIGDSWYNAMFDTQFQEVNRGDSVELQMVMQGDKPVVGNVSVTQKAPVQSNGYGGKRKGFIDNSIGQGVGMAVNNAVDLCIAEVGAYDLSFIESKACDIYELAEKLKANATAGNIRGQSIQPTQGIVDNNDSPFVS